jgi:RNA polymerase sigma factor (sigma-70 family)
LELLPNIVSGCALGNSRDQKALYERYYGYCLKVVFRYIYRYDKAVDVVNDGFVKIFRSFSKFECKFPDQMEMMLMGWMRTIMINTAIDQLRKNNFIPEIGDLTEEGAMVEDRSRGSDQNLLYKDIIKEIRRLPPSYRAVFNMYVIDGMPHQEIADHLGISVGTSKSNLSKARVILQKILKRNDEHIVICS